MLDRKTLVAAGVVFGLATPGLASAGWERGTLTIQNQFDGQVEVWVEGRYQGLVGGDATSSFVLTPGSKDVRVVRAGTGYVLASTRVNLCHGASYVMPVRAPGAQLRVANQGELSLKLLVDGATLWISPGATAQVAVESGNVELVGMLKEPRGEWRAVERNVWVEPGQVGYEVLRPDPTVLVVTNRERFPVHALLDGADGGWINPGQSERIWVRPGSTTVVLRDGAGNVRYSERVWVTRGQEGRVVLTGPPVYVGRPVPPVVVYNDRPGGPIRR